MEAVLSLVGMLVVGWLIFQIVLYVAARQSSRPIPQGAQVRVVYTLEAPDKLAAEAMAAELSEIHLYGEVEAPDPDDPDEGWACIASERDVYELEPLRERLRQVDTIARTHGGRCEDFSAHYGERSAWHDDGRERADEDVEDDEDSGVPRTLAMRRHLFGPRGTVRIGPGEIIVQWADGRSRVVPRREIRQVQVMIFPPFHWRVIIDHGEEAQPERVSFLIRSRDEPALLDAI